LKKKVTFGDLISDFEFYIECPECDTELIAMDFFKSIKCSKCGHIFKLHMLKARKVSHTNPSMRGFSIG